MTFSTFAFAFALVLLSGLSTSIGGALAVGRRQPGPAFMAAAPVSYTHLTLPTIYSV